MISVRGLSKLFAARQALAEVSFDIPAGSVAGLLGPNGAGKTTLISILNGFLAPDRGRVEIAGLDLKTSLSKIRSLTGLVPQELAFYPQMTGRENLDFFASLMGLGAHEIQKRLAWVAHLCALEDRLDERSSHYSGGQKRRLNLAIGLLSRPKILYLDEPTVGIDPYARNRILEILGRLAREEGMTVVYTSHYLEEMERLCDYLLVLDAGRLVASGPLGDVLGSSTLEAFWMRLAQGDGGE